WPIPSMVSCARTYVTPRGSRPGKGEPRVDPWVKNPSAALNPGPFGEGDRVRLLWGVTPVEGIVIEDRGNLGVGGKRFYRVRIRIDECTEPVETERPVEDLTLVARAPTRPRKRRRGKCTGDHGEGGLASAEPDAR